MRTRAPATARTTDGCRAPSTFAIDIGGTNIKAAVLDRAGVPIGPRVRCPTPKPGTPSAVLEATSMLSAQLPPFERISVGFPGVVKGGSTITAPNLGTENWAHYRLLDALAGRFGVPARILNDAAVQGLGVVRGDGLECAITLGTGIGCALFRNGRLLLPLELGQHLQAEGVSYDRYIGDGARQAIGSDAWNDRVHACVRIIVALTTCDVIYIGGGNARRIAFELPPQVRVVDNSAGVTGGVRLWEPELDELFSGESSAQWRDR